MLCLDDRAARRLKWVGAVIMGLILILSARTLTILKIDLLALSHWHWQYDTERTNPENSQKERHLPPQDPP